MADWFDQQRAPAPSGGGAPGGTGAGGGAPSWFDTPAAAGGGAGGGGGGGGAPTLESAFEHAQTLVGPDASREEMEAALTTAFKDVPGFTEVYKESVRINGQWYDLVGGYGAPGGRWQLMKKGGASGGGSAGMQAALETSPGYQFRLEEGLKGIERGAAAKGTLLTGGTAKALQRYAQDYASGEYQNRYNQLYGLSTLGLNAAGNAANLGSSYAANAGNLATGGANANAAGTVAAANAWAQGLGNAANTAQQAYWMWLLNQGQKPAGT